MKRSFRRFRKFGIGPVSLELEPTAADCWPELGESLTEALGKDVGAKWLFLLDEVSLFVQHLLERDTERCRKFLNWLRELRIGPRAARRNRWFITGSIGLPTITRAVSLGDTINDLHSPFDHYGPFTAETAESFLFELAKGHSFSMANDVVQRVLERVGWHIPYHLQCVFSKLRDHKPPLSPDSVDQAINSLIETGKIFEFWEQRINRHLKPTDAKQALAILDPVARDPNGASQDTLSQSIARLVADVDERAKALRFLLDMLVADGYLVRDGVRYRFLSPLLREYWRRHLCND